MSHTIEIRAARIEDEGVIADFNCRLSLESEHNKLDRETVTLGVRAVLLDPSKGRYFVACVDGVRVGQIMHTWEWSDWRNGMLWWLQSVYVLPEYRGRGLFRRLYEHVRQLGESDPQVAGIRLYVEQENQNAREVYRRLGLRDSGYLVMESGVRRSW